MIFYMIPSEAKKSRFTKSVMTVSCFLLSFLNPILLVSACEGAKERARNLAETLDASLSQQMMKLKCIKSQWATFIKIEIGNFEKLK